MLEKAGINDTDIEIKGPTQVCDFFFNNMDSKTVHSSLNVIFCQILKSTLVSVLTKPFYLSILLSVCLSIHLSIQLSVFCPFVHLSVSEHLFLLQGKFSVIFFHFLQAFIHDTFKFCPTILLYYLTSFSCIVS